ncbi:unnamed protein product, partial [Effrenium voratum]
ARPMVRPPLHPLAAPAQVGGFSKFFQRISGHAAQEDHKEDKDLKDRIKVAEREELKDAKTPAEAKPVDEDERIQEVHKLDQKFVSLVLGKKQSLAEQSGASIEIDQNLPAGMPRMVIYRGTKKQVTTAKRLLDGVVQKEEKAEKEERATAAVVREKDEKRTEDGRTDLPLWRRGKPGEEEKPPERRRKEWNKPKEIEAAPSGSLTGSLTAAASMRPAWMRPKEPDESKFSDKSVWSEQKYSRSLFLQAKQKILKMKAYEVPEEMMTMTTGPRPKYRKENDEDDEERRERRRKAKEAKEAERARLQLEQSEQPEPLESEQQHRDRREHEREPDKTEVKHQPKVKAEARPRNASYENLPGDSKELLKLKKKLREIQKIEDAMAAGETVEPLQAEKVNKKEAYLDELRFLESIQPGELG